jgi:hypothetical protein
MGGALTFVVVCLAVACAWVLGALQGWNQANLAYKRRGNADDPTRAKADGG